MSDLCEQTTKKARIAVLISGQGSNMKALIEAFQDTQSPAEIVAVLSNQGDAKGLVFAEEKGIPTRIIPHTNFPKNRLAFDEAMSQALEEFSPDWICLAGYMRLVTPWFCEKWHNRLVNIHPSLLPSFKGMDGVRQAYEARVKVSGCTVHLVRAEFDSGPILAQVPVPLYSSDQIEDISARILEQEHLLYPCVMKALCLGALKIEDDTIIGDV